MTHHVWVRGLLPWIEPARLLGPGEWRFEAGSAQAELPTHAAADLDARLRGLGIGGAELELGCTPPLPRAAVRAARTTDARRRRDTTPGFLKPGARLDPEGRWSLTPEALALALGRRAAGRRVVDAGCGAGGNTLGFVRAGCVVTAIERDAARLADARHNAALYGVADKVRFVHGDVLRLLPELDADLVFLDPPWGPEWSRRRSHLAELPLLEAALALPLRAPAVWAKLPPSLDVRELPELLPNGARLGRPEAWYGAAEGDRRRVKFLLVTWSSGVWEGSR